MNYLTPAQARAQLLSLFVFGSIAQWYVAPWLNSRSRADALIALLWIHVFRYIALMMAKSARDYGEGQHVLQGGLPPRDRHRTGRIQREVRDLPSASR
jgi:hypothetical protein